VFAWLYFSDKNAKWFKKNTYLPLLKHLETHLSEESRKADDFVPSLGPVRDKLKAFPGGVAP
jgi:hypothetical protein